MYYISLPHLEDFVLVTKESFFELVDRVSMESEIIKIQEDGKTHFFVLKYYYDYEYLGFCIYEN